MKAIDVMQVGLGPLGEKIMQYLQKRPGAFNIVDVVDVDPAKVGTDIGVEVVGSVQEVVKYAKPQVAVVTTVSDILRAKPGLVTMTDIPTVSFF